MGDHKQYTREVVINIIQVMAQSGAGIKPSDEEIDKVPKEFHRNIIAALMAARAIKEMRTLEMMPRASLIKEILEEAMKKTEESKED